MFKPENKKQVFATGRKLVIILLIVTIPMNLVHESGHAIICKLEGFDYTMYLSSLVCNGNVSNKLLFNSFGGMLAGIISLTPFLFWRYIKDKPYIIISSFAILSGQIPNMIIEGFFKTWYMSNPIPSTIIINGISCGVIIYLLLKHDKLVQKENKL